MEKPTLLKPNKWTQFHTGDIRSLLSKKLGVPSVKIIHPCDRERMIAMLEVLAKSVPYATASAQRCASPLGQASPIEPY